MTRYTVLILIIAAFAGLISLPFEAARLLLKRRAPGAAETPGAVLS